MVYSKSVCIKLLSVVMFLVLVVSVSVARPLKAIAVSGGEEHSVVLTEDGQVFTAGDNQFCQLGRTSDPYNKFLPVDGGDMDTASGLLENISAISAGWLHTVVADAQGFCWTWGDDLFYPPHGFLGKGDNITYADVPVQVEAGEQDTFNSAAPLQDIIAVAAGRSGTHSLAIEDGTGFVYAWGNNNMGQLGIDSTVSQSRPVKVLGGEMGTPFLQDIIAVSAGEEHSMALGNGFVWTWGENSWNDDWDTHKGIGKLGINNTQDNYIETPVQVLGVNGIGFLSNIAAISAGWNHSMALEQFDPLTLLDPAVSSGRVFTWGNNGTGYEAYFCNGGRLGDGTTTDRAVPVLVLKGEQDSATDYLENIIAISAGESHCLALDTFGKVWAWGDNKYGQLGIGKKASDYDYPTDAKSLTPVRVLGPEGVGYLSDIVAISAGYWHNLAIDEDGVVWVWGKGASGALGLGDTDNRKTPVPIVLSVPEVWNVTQDIRYRQIQPAVNEADEGDVIVVTEGVYEETVNFGSKRITLRSSDPDDPVVVANTVIDGNGSNVLTFTDNLRSAGLFTLVEGLTLRNGGNGINSSNSDPIISKCVITNCSTGVYALNYSMLTFENCTIENGNGYGIYSFQSDVELFDSIMRNYYSYGLYFSFGSAYLENCLFKNNANSLYGDSYSEFYVYDSTFDGDHTTQTGIVTYGYLDMEGCLVRNYLGNGIYGYGATLFVHTSLIEGNGGSGIKADSYSLLQVENSLIKANGEDGLYTASATSFKILNNWLVDNDGYGIYLLSPLSRPEIRNNTIAQNTVGIYRSGGIDPDVTSCIIWDNGVNLSGSFGRVTYCCIDNGHAGQDNISDNPLFIDAQSGNFHIAANSPCVDAGDTSSVGQNETDIDGEPRIFNGMVDIGADEVYYSLCDLNDDEIVNYADYVIFARAWETETGDPDWNAACDFDDDGIVDENDLFLFIEEWLWTPAAYGLPFEDIGGRYGATLLLGDESLLLLRGMEAEPLAAKRQVEPQPADAAVVREIIDWLDDQWRSGELKDIPPEAYVDLRIALERTLFVEP